MTKIYHCLECLEVIVSLKADFHSDCLFNSRRSRGKKSDKPDDVTEDKHITDDMSKLSMTPEQSNVDAQSPFLPWTRTNTSSESEYSDTEGGQSSKLRTLHCRVRQCAFSTFHAVVKVTFCLVKYSTWIIGVTIHYFTVLMLRETSVNISVLLFETSFVFFTYSGYLIINYISEINTKSI
jgi:hypothetical protein